MSELWQGIIYGFLASIVGGFIVSVVNHYVKKALRSRGMTKYTEKMRDDRDEQLFAQYLIENPHLIAVVRGNYRAKLCVVVGQYAVAWVATIAIATCGYFLTVAITRLPWAPDTFNLYFAMVILVPTIFIYLAIAFDTAKLTSRMRRVTAVLDLSIPASTDLSDEVWRRFPPRDY